MKNATIGQAEIDRIVEAVDGGARNVQDIYPLAPLQEGILFHHLFQQERDPYLLWRQLQFPDLAHMTAYVGAVNAVVQRHDALRTAFIWEGLSEPVQVVWRRAPVVLEEIAVELEAGNVATELKRRFEAGDYRIDVRRAPLLRVLAARDSSGWIMMQLLHHLCADHVTFEVMQGEISQHLQGRGANLPTPVPFRNYVAQALLGVGRAEHEAFFKGMLSDVDEPTAPFGRMDVMGNGIGVEEASLELSNDLVRRLRGRARLLGVGVASICHVAWGLVVSRTSGREHPVFGTVLFGRMQGGVGAERALGLYINTLPVRVTLGALGAKQSVLKMHRLLADLLHHEHAPLAMAQRCSSVRAPTPLFTSLLNYRHSLTAMYEQIPFDRDGIRELGTGGYTNYGMMLSIEDRSDKIVLNAQSAASTSPSRLCAMMRRALDELVHALEVDPDASVNRLEVLPRAELQRLLVAWNTTDVAYPSHLCIHELFECQVRRNANAVALVFEGTSLTYGELNVQANKVARRLVDLGIAPDNLVGLCVDRSFEMVIGLLGIWKAGAAYLPLDPDYPVASLTFMLDDAAPTVVVTNSRALPRLQEAVKGARGTPFVLDMGQAVGEGVNSDEGNLSRDTTGVTSRSLAYVIYTSGSTGRPKGVMIEHRSLVARILCMQETYGLGGVDAVLQKIPFNFDVSVWEFAWTLMSGARLVIARPEGHKDPQYLSGIIEKESITAVTFVPSMLTTFLEESDPSALVGLRELFCIGEQLTPSLIERCRKAAPKARLSNLYGPTEATLYCTAWSTHKYVAGSPVSIGRPISNTKIYILDAAMQPVPAGAVGEIYIGGVGVARGYLNRPDLTLERFVDSPFVAGDRLYKTGDLGAYHQDGDILFLGRNDLQVKIRGFRIELGEIESRLLVHPAIREGLVLARDDRVGSKQLVAYYVKRSEATIVQANDLRRFMALTLPEHMVPAAYMELPALPVMPSGKLDRKSLPAPANDAYAHGIYVEPLGDTERTIAEIWGEILGTTSVGRYDNFFELGGDSITAVRIVERMRRVGIALAVRDIFATPELSDLAAMITEPG